MSPTLQLSWVQCQANVNRTWCSLVGPQALYLDSDHFNGLEGVYIIWHGGPNPGTVRIGQGLIRDRLIAHREDRAVLSFALNGLYATWAEVPTPFRAGVERYLAEALNPKVGARFPEAPAISINLPW